MRFFASLRTTDRTGEGLATVPTGGRQLTVEPHTLRGIRRHRSRRATGRALTYAALLVWTFISLFPLYWTVTTSFKTAVDVTQGHLIPWVDFEPDWRGLALARAVTGQDRRGLDGATGIPAAFRQQHHGFGRRLAAGHRDRLACGVRPQPLQVQARALAQRRPSRSSSCRN